MSLAPVPAAALCQALLPRVTKVLAVKEEVPGTVTLRLEAGPPTGKPPFLPGQFNMLYVFGIGEVPISLAGDPENDPDLVHTVRAVGIATRALTSLKAGDTVGVRGPFGSGWPVAEAKDQDVLLVAGGLGVAPLRPALCQLLHQRSAYGRIILLYGTRTPEDLLYAADLRAWAARADLELQVTVDHAGPGWTGNVGVALALLAGLGLAPNRTTAMLCGPEVMMRFTIRELERLGFGAEQLYVSLERNMKCATGFCGHCQYGPVFVCKDGPIFRYDRVARLFNLREV